MDQPTGVRQTGAASRLRIVDHEETYGRHVLERFADGLHVDRCLDLGCGRGADLSIIQRLHPRAHCSGVEHGDGYDAHLRSRGIAPVHLDIERGTLPFPSSSIDLIIANQVLEHAKEIFWINHEIFRCLTVGGHLYIGVPNVLSLHNRLLGLFGVHPTSSKIISAHVRVFSRGDTRLFYDTIGGGLATIERFSGSQFYPFPRLLSRPLSRMLPGMAFSIFFLIRKTREYRGEFLGYLVKCPLETNFYAGDRLVAEGGTGA